MREKTAILKSEQAPVEKTTNKYNQQRLSVLWWATHNAVLSVVVKMASSLRGFPSQGR